MRWNIRCAGCGLSLQVGQGQVGRLLSCPECLLRFTPTAPSEPSAPIPVPKPRNARFRRVYVIGGLAGLLLVGLAIGATLPRRESGKTPRYSPGGVLLSGMFRGSGLGGPGGRDANLFPSMLELGVPVEEPTLLSETPLISRGDPPLPTFALAGKIPSTIAVAFDPSSESLLTSTRLGRLHRFSRQGWNEVGSCQLDRIAYQLVVDSRRRLLYAATTTPATLRLSELGDRQQAHGDIEIFDLETILRSTQLTITPVRSIPIGAHLTGMLLSPDGGHLYYLAESTDRVQVGKIDTSTWQQAPTQTIRAPGPSALTLSPDGTTLHALAGARLLSIDAAAWKVTCRLTFNGAVQSVVAASDDRLFVLERGRGGYSQIRVVDLAKRQVLARWTTQAEGRPYLVASPDHKRVFLATSGFMTGSVWALNISKPEVLYPVVLGHVASSRERLLRGGLFVTGDGRHIVTGTGQVYHVEF